MEIHETRISSGIINLVKVFLSFPIEVDGLHTVLPIHSQRYKIIILSLIMSIMIAFVLQMYALLVIMISVLKLIRMCLKPILFPRTLL